VALRATDGRLDEFVAPSHAGGRTDAPPPQAPLALVRRAIADG
jgi:hypothetical protein